MGRIGKPSCLTTNKESGTMANEDKGKHMKLWTPAIYRITVEGHVEETWSDRLGKLNITTRIRADESVVTTLVGRMRDQAQLTGVLNTLYEMHLPILSVENLSQNDGGQAGQQAPEK
jgi:hypothetical protein